MISGPEAVLPAKQLQMRMTGGGPTLDLLNKPGTPEQSPTSCFPSDDDAC